VSSWIAGVDGCRAGWIVARQAMHSPRRIDVEIHRNFATILDAADPPTVLAVDMPIGLPARIGVHGRGPEKEIRRFLGRRKSSVFSIPSRSAVCTQDYPAACLIAAETSDPSRKFAKQAFNLFPKIREIDALLRASPKGLDPPWRERVFEAHPELAFWRLNGEKELSHAKKTRNGQRWIGRQERVAILEAAGVPSDVLKRAPPRGAAADDLLDALALVMIARRILDGQATSFPDPPGRDSFGLPVAIWA
jgi:threonine dehydratase